MYTRGMLWYDFWPYYPILLPQAMNFSLFSPFCPLVDACSWVTAYAPFKVQSTHIWWRDVMVWVLTTRLHPSPLSHGLYYFSTFSLPVKEHSWATAMPHQRGSVKVYWGGVLWYEFWPYFSIQLCQAIDFGSFPHGACCLRSAAEHQPCPLEGTVWRYTEGMLWCEFWPQYSIHLPLAMDFGTFPHLAD